KAQLSVGPRPAFADTAAAQGTARCALAPGGQAAAAGNAAAGGARPVVSGRGRKQRPDAFVRLDADGATGRQHRSGRVVLVRPGTGEGCSEERAEGAAQAP